MHSKQKSNPLTVSLRLQRTHFIVERSIRIPHLQEKWDMWQRKYLYRHTEHGDEPSQSNRLGLVDGRHRH